MTMTKEILKDCLLLGFSVVFMRIKKSPDTLIKDHKDKDVILSTLDYYNKLYNSPLVSEQTDIKTCFDIVFDYFKSNNDDFLKSLYYYICIGTEWGDALGRNKYDITRLTQLQSQIRALPRFPKSAIYDHDLLISVIWNICKFSAFDLHIDEIKKQMLDEMWNFFTPVLNPGETGESYINDLDRYKHCFTVFDDIQWPLIAGNYLYSYYEYGLNYNEEMDEDRETILQSINNVLHLSHIDHPEIEYEFTDDPAENDLSFLYSIYYYAFKTNPVICDLIKIGMICTSYKKAFDDINSFHEKLKEADELTDSMIDSPFSFIPGDDKDAFKNTVSAYAKEVSFDTNPEDKCFYETFYILREIANTLIRRYFPWIETESNYDFESIIPQEQPDTEAVHDTATAPDSTIAGPDTAAIHDSSAAVPYTKPAALKSETDSSLVYTSGIENSESSDKYVFISYSSKDSATATTLRDLLQDNNIKCWMAPGSIPVGEDYTEVIVDAIEKSSGVVLILSENSQNSKWVPKELDIAISADKVIFPIHIDDSVIAKKLRFRLTDSQSIEVNGDITSVLYDLLISIKKHMS